MINEYTKSDTSTILHIINDASLRYKGIIPHDCWYEPYMSKQELIDAGAHCLISSYHDLMKNVDNL